MENEEQKTTDTAIVAADNTAVSIVYLVIKQLF